MAVLNPDIRLPGLTKLLRFSKIRAYVAAAFLVLAAAGVDVLVTPLFHGRAPLTMFIIAVALAALYGGLGPGLFATAVSVGCIELLFAKSIVSLLTGQPSVLLFSFFGVGISVLIESFQRRNRSLEHAKELLEAANKELAKRSEDLAQSNDELRRFAYALSHDLQSPLRNVSLFTELLAEKVGDRFDEDAQRSMRFILEGAQRAREMIRRLLEYSIADHKTRVEAMTDLNSVLAAALAEVRPDLEKSAAQVTSEVLPAIQADGDRLQQVFLNLLSNAIKYRSERPLEIRVLCRKVGDEWIISVSDNGIGIDQRYAERIFGLFERLHSPDDYEGSGIGLAICRTIIKRHGGRIWVESELDRGSTFYIALPIQRF